VAINAGRTSVSTCLFRSAQNAERINQFKAGVNWKFLPNFL
jgi:hypothetical protein